MQLFISQQAIREACSREVGQAEAGNLKKLMFIICHRSAN